MSFQVRKIGNFYIIDVPFDGFSYSKRKHFQKIITDIIYKNGRNIILNLVKVKFLDGLGLGELLDLQKTALYYNINIRLYGLNDYVKNMLDQTNLKQVFGISLSNNDDNLINIIKNDSKSSEFVFAKFLKKTSETFN